MYEPARDKQGIKLFNQGLENQNKMEQVRQQSVQMGEDENYAEYARKVYYMAEKEGWSKAKTFEMLQDPSKMKVQSERCNDPVVQRMLEDQRKREIKKQQLIEQQKKLEDEEVSKLSIKTSQNKSDKKKKKMKKRSHNEFMEDQVRFEQKRYEKLKNVIDKEEEEESRMFKPQVSKKTEKIVKKKQENIDNSKVHDRLFQYKSNQAQSQMNLVLENDKFEFKPSINKKSQNLKREQDIVSYLEIDSKRRQENKKRSDITKEEQEKIPKELRFKKISDKNQQLLYEKLEHDLGHVMNEMNFDIDQLVEVDEIRVILQQLGMTGNGQAMSAQVDDFIQIISRKGDRVKLLNVKVLICAILNMNFGWMRSEDQDRKFNSNEIGEFNEEDQFQLTEQEIQWIVKHFCLLHAARQDFQLQNSKTRCPCCNNYQIQHDFKPQTCRASQRMTESRTLDGSHFDHLIQAGLNYQERRKKLAEEKEQRELEELKYKRNPKKKQVEKDSDIQKLKKKKEQELRKKSPEPKKERPINKQPKQQRNQTASPKNKKISQGMQKLLQKKVKDYQVFEKQFEDEPPLLLVDINLGQNLHRIALFFQSNPKFVGEEFAKEKGLGPVQAESLIQMLQEQFNNAIKSKKKK